MNDNRANTNNTTSEQKEGATGYSVLLTPIEISTKDDRRGKPYMKARVSTALRDGRMVERTMMARGKALDNVKGKLAVGQEARVRVIYSETDHGAPYFTALCMARHQPGEETVAQNDNEGVAAAA